MQAAKRAAQRMERTEGTDPAHLPTSSSPPLCQGAHVPQWAQLLPALHWAEVNLSDVGDISENLAQTVYKTLTEQPNK